ncbi:MAG: MbnP family protein [Salibacteraceae bacterium]
MKYLKYPLLFALSTFLWVGCDSDDDVNENVCEPTETMGSLRVNIAGMVNGSNLDLGTEYTLSDGNRLRIDRLKYYLSDIRLVRTDGSETMIKDVILVDYDLTPSGNPAIPNWTNEFVVDAPTGEYTGIKFDLGVRQDLNESDPATYGSDHPLSASTENMYWSWATMYKFVVLEGKADVGSGSFDESVVFHTGTNNLYRQINTISQAVVISENQQTDFDVSLDIEALFDGPGGQIDLSVSPVSHTGSGASFTLAETFTNNMVVAFGN